MYLIETLKSIKEENLISFHVPGHKYHPLFLKELEAFDHILQMDITEIPGSDDLFHPETCLLKAQEEASNLYRVKQSFFLVNGTTSGIYAMIMTVTKPGDKILVSRDCHRAVYDGILLGQLNVAYIEPEIHNRLNIPLGLTLESIKVAVDENPEAKALVLTYPNYYGVGCDLKSIASYLKSKNILFLIDAAHGAHLMLSDDLIEPAEKYGDIVVHSAHKSLPVMTQASLLHVCSDQIDINKLKFMLKLHHTSSPSYVLMASLDIGIHLTKVHGREKMKNLLESIYQFKEKHKYFLSQEDLPENFYLDATKLVLKGVDSNLDPRNVEEKLRKNNVQLEFSNEETAVFVTSFMNEKADFDYLTKMMEMLNFKCYSGIGNLANRMKLQPKMSISDALYHESEIVFLKDSIGKISKSYVIPYPPGIPSIVPGEMINDNIIDLIYKWSEQNFHIVGLPESNGDLKIEIVSLKEE
ncbi:MAG: aminotransferase class V-fold PLP-dependent enzyme [Clostridia bacterium]|nr:aminotransferase class V-fold PLP-dependent enzyme [Clostridia bacterium]